MLSNQFKNSINKAHNITQWASFWQVNRNFSDYKITFRIFNNQQTSKKNGTKQQIIGKKVNMYISILPYESYNQSVRTDPQTQKKFEETLRELKEYQTTLRPVICNQLEETVSIIDPKIAAIHDLELQREKAKTVISEYSEQWHEENYHILEEMMRDGIIDAVNYATDIAKTDEYQQYQDWINQSFMDKNSPQYQNVIMPSADNFIERLNRKGILHVSKPEALKKCETYLVNKSTLIMTTMANTKADIYMQASEPNEVERWSCQELAKKGDIPHEPLYVAPRTKTRKSSEQENNNNSTIEDNTAENGYNRPNFG